MGTVIQVSSYMQKSRLLRAREAAEFRGHELRTFTKLGPTSWNSYCKTCNMEVVVDINPPANGIEIAGEAVALNCIGE